VKNTFIDVREAETPASLASRGAQTAMARIGAEQSVCFTPEVDAGIATADPLGYNGRGQQGFGIGQKDQKDYTRVGSTEFKSTASTLSPSEEGTFRTADTSISDGEVRFDASSPGYPTPGLMPPPPSTQAPYGGAPAVLPYPVGHPGPVPYAVSPVVGTPMTAAPPSPAAFPVGHSPLPAPPPYAAPMSFKDQTSQPPLEEARSYDSMNRYDYNVKNTFIDVPDDATPMGNQWQTAQTCQARFVNEDSLAFKPVGSGVYGAQGAVSPTAQPVSLASASVGSAEHGKTGPDGSPACQPCAWFYKDNGCKNGQTCRYCHICPNGELKNRKKMKISRLRNQDGNDCSASAETPPHGPRRARPQ